MNLLAIDTSTERASIALLYEGRIQHLEHNARAQHAKWVLPAVNQLLLEAGITLQQLDGIVFGQGPGSFTGLRIACSIAKGLGYGADLPLYPVSTLKAIVEELQFQKPEYKNHLTCSVIDASMSQIYWSICCNNEFQDEHVSFTSDISNLWQVKSNLAIVVAGVGLTNYREGLEHAFHKNEATHFVEVYPSATAMVRLVLSGHSLAVSAQHALPTYIRDKVTQ